MIDALARTNFYLAYQGEDDKALQQQYAGFIGALLDRVWPEYRAPERTSI